MRLAVVFGVALRRLRQRPVRTFLLLQGTIWGVAVAIFPSAVIQGTREATRTHGAALGADRIALTADPTSARGDVLQRGDLVALRSKLADAGMTVRAMGGVRRLRPLPGRAGRPTATLLTSTVGAEAARGLELAAGRWLQAGDGSESCVVEAAFASSIGRPPLAPGDQIQLPGLSRPLEVVGVTRPRSAEVLRTNDLGFDIEHTMYKRVGSALLLALGIPLVQDDWKRTDCCVYVPARDDDGVELDWFFVRVNPEQISAAALAARDLLAQRGKAAVSLYPLVLPVVMGEQIDRFAAVNLAMFLACLIMGAVVMMNLGLLNVLSRQREIAILRTEGATQRDVERQFLLEGLLLAAVGATLGGLLGAGLAQLRVALEPVTGFTWTYPWREASWAFSVALLVGLLSSFLPARRAARQDPVQGLADE